MDDRAQFDPDRPTEELASPYRLPFTRCVCALERCDNTVRMQLVNIDTAPELKLPYPWVTMIIPQAVQDKDRIGDLRKNFCKWQHLMMYLIDVHMEHVDA